MVAKLIRGEHIVLAFSEDNLLQLVVGQVLRVHGRDVGVPGITLYFTVAKDHDELVEDLKRAGYDFAHEPAKGDGNGGSEEG